MKKPWWKFWGTKEERDKVEYDAGYEWAAVELLQGENPIIIIEFIKDVLYSDEEVPNFNAGASDAIEDFRRLVGD